MSTVPARPAPRSPLQASFAKDAAVLQPVVRAVVARVLSQGRTHPDVEDCTSEAMRRAFEGFERLRPGEPIRPWLLGIARHVAIDHLRERGRQHKRCLAPSLRSDLASEDLVDRVPDSAPAPDELVARLIQRQRVEAAMQTLVDGQRQALILFHVEELGYQQIAQRLGVPLGTVATWVSRGRRAIAQALQDPVREA